ncbi:peroxisomal catalase 1-like [Maniola jurtina]|uniref:peroxisomal catalase 1-like n=1 Tax=Maniola jurtina TaxID=191418 RepID=UPI001E68AB04|nr:peroxisomal catalase 1-like [Maniola jurtina]
MIRGKRNVYWLFFVQVVNVLCSDKFEEYLNVTDPATCQIYEFRNAHSIPVGLITTSFGKLVEIRETVTLNSDAFSNQHHIDLVTHMNDERIPERLVHAKGGGAFGYFEVTHDVSKYTKADVLNGVGKKTQVFVRVSTVLQNLGGNDVARDIKGFAVKFYTREGNWDLLCLSTPVFFHRDPIDFPSFIHAFKRNPKTNLFDFTTRWDFVTKKPETLTSFLYVLSDYGIPNGYRKMEYFAIHTFEINNKHGDKYFVRFNFRPEQGIEILTTEEALALGARDPDYYNRDLYNAIEYKKYPAWKLEMDVMTLDSIKHIDYNPFEVTRLWKKGTYHTVPIGRLVLNRNPDNFFRTVEMSAFNPSNLIPGIPGPMDNLFRTRRSSYRETQAYRLGINHNRIKINEPLYWKVYSRDGKPPVGENMKDAPNYYPNSFNGPIPLVDPTRPKKKFKILEANAIDLEVPAYFYNHYLCDEGQRQRLVNNTVSTLVPVSPHMQRRVLRLLSLADPILGIKVATGLEAALETPRLPPPSSIKILRHHYKRHNKMQCTIKKH